MGGKSQSVNDTLQADRQAAMQRQNQVFDKQFADTPELTSWRGEKSKWDQMLASKDYSNPGGILGFDLWNPAKTQENVAKMSNLEGVGAASFAGQGDSSIALAQAKERNANEAAQNAGASYENAFKQQDDYFKGANFNYMNAENSKFGNLFGQTSANANNLTNNWVGYKSKPSPWGQILGGALGAAGSIFAGAGGK